MNKYSFSIIGAGALWGLMGFFVRNMTALGFDSPGIVIIRCSVSALCFGALMLLRDKRLFVIRLRDMWCFIGVGIFSLLFFTYCYFKTINLTDLSVASILLYTAPSMVMVMSLILFRERLTGKKITALILAFAGCCLVSGIGGGARASLMGLILGLCSGFGYALYSIFAAFALRRGYDSLTINFYACLLAAIGAVIIWGVQEPVSLMFASAGNLVWSLGVGIVACFFPYLLYTYGLTATEPGKASVMASVEPVVATLCGIFIFDEKMTFDVLTGICLVLSAIVILNLHGRTRQKSEP